MSNLDIRVFHGTDEFAAKEIVKDRFIVKGSKEYWLGNGVYFFLDHSLAEWWTTHPSKSFGKEIENPSILNCNVIIDDSEILDLRKLSDYEVFADIYKNEFIVQYAKKRLSSKIISVKELRCTYCDFLKNNYQLKAIISNFSPTSQEYLSNDYGIYFKDFDIVYTETQMCVFDQNIIKEKIIEYLEPARKV